MGTPAYPNQDGIARLNRRLLPLLMATAAAVPLRAAESQSGAEFFETKIRPVLAANCFKCHSAAANKIKGGLRLDDAASILKGGDTAPAVKPGDPDASLLIRAIRYTDRDIQMPPAGKLPDAVIRDFEAWVAMGAPVPLGESGPPADANSLSSDSPGKPETWWSLGPVAKPQPPALNDPWIQNEIDGFILAKLKEKGLSPSPAAERREFIRRASLDLTGLPPTIEEINAFVKDAAPDAYEKLIDRLLASPRYGERWARHWLDVARFAETNGFETNTPRPRAWPYRDYVINAFNSDKPYNQFVIEQIAGDAFGAPVATGFLVGGAWDEVKSPDKELTLNQRANELHDMVSTLSGAFLGLTAGCARCHDHKFDPISQRDYYALTAALAGVNHGERELELPENDARRAEIAKAEAALGAIARRMREFDPIAEPTLNEPRRAPVNARLNIERFAAIEARAVRFTIEATNSAEPCLDEIEVMTAGDAPRNVALASAGGVPLSLGNYQGDEKHKFEHINDGRFGNGRSWISNQPGRGSILIRWPEPQRVDTILWARDRDGQFNDRLATKYKIELKSADGQWVVVASSSDRRTGSTQAGGGEAHHQLVIDTTAGDAMEWLDLQMIAAELRRRVSELREAGRAYAGVFREPEPTRLLRRGDPMQPAEPVAPGGIAAVNPPLAVPPDLPERERRIALARWITSRDNPLAARVMVNRVWHYHFGVGLVATPSDFGAMGAAPSHPELLDWLASGFVERNWSVKSLHKLIMLSGAYRQSSRPNEKAIAVDAGARLLWRFPPRRLEAEALRDSILFVSGALNPARGGPGFDLFEPNTNYVHVYIPKSSFGPDEFRRMVYQTKPRNIPDATFGVFDCPDAAQPQPRRTSSTTPLQALNLLNSPFMLQQAELFAERVEKECPDKNPERRAAMVFETALGRPPTDEEKADTARLAREHGLATLCRALFNADEFIRIE